MDRHDEAVMQLLTANGETFVAPKYEVADGWQCPAFVALRPARKQVYVVEVSASGYPLAQVNRLNERLEKWVAPLLSQLHGLGVTAPDWDIACLVFVRSDQIDWLKERVKDLSGVHVLSLEQASSPWLWDDSVWTSEMQFNAGAIPLKLVKPSGLTH